MYIYTSNGDGHSRRIHAHVLCAQSHHNLCIYSPAVASHRDLFLKNPSFTEYPVHNGLSSMKVVRVAEM